MLYYLTAPLYSIYQCAHSAHKKGCHKGHTRNVHIQLIKRDVTKVIPETWPGNKPVSVYAVPPKNQIEYVRSINGWSENKLYSFTPAAISAHKIMGNYDFHLAIDRAQTWYNRTTSWSKQKCY